MTKKRETMEWGSCQYDAAAEMFDRCIEMEGDIGRKAVFDALGLVKPMGVSMLAASVYDKMLQMHIDSCDDDDEREHVRNIADTHYDKTISNCFKICACMSWDLWSTAPHIVKLVFPNIDLDNIPPTPHSKLYGPTLNQIAQAGNDCTGFCCWLLMSFGLADELDFIGFDT
jgi:hypothetical protein